MPASSITASRSSRRTWTRSARSRWPARSTPSVCRPRCTSTTASTTALRFFRSLERKSAAFYSMGITKADEEKFRRVMDAAADAVEYVCIDVANGYHENFVTFVTRIRTAYPRLVIMAGNVVTGEMTEELILSGADIVKVGHRARIGLHDAPDDRRRLPAAFGGDRVRRCRARPVGPDLRRRRLHHTRRCGQGLRRRGGLRHARRHVRRT